MRFSTLIDFIFYMCIGMLVINIANSFRITRYQKKIKINMSSKRSVDPKRFLAIRHNQTNIIDNKLATHSNDRSISSIKTSSSSSTVLKNSYQYIDSGNNSRLEKFGPLYVIRSCPTANWKRNSRINEWNQQDSTIKYIGKSGKTGIWNHLEANSDIVNNPLSNWTIKMDKDITFILNPSEYGQIGVFPEQLPNWKWITQQCNEHVNFITNKYPIFNYHANLEDVGIDEDIDTYHMENHLYKLENSSKLNKFKSKMRVLNAFAYTGGSTMAAARALHVEVVHLDSAKSVMTSAIRNVHISGLKDRPIRFMIDDCMRFIDREYRRRNRYDGLIFDPPAFGRSVGHQMWKLEDDLPLLASKFKKLLTPKAKFVLLTCHDINWPGERLADLLNKHLPSDGLIEFGDLTLTPTVNEFEKIPVILGNSLPLGQFARWYRPENK